METRRILKRDGTESQGRGWGTGVHAQVRKVVAYAAERFIEVVPEIELPGHCGAAIACYPHLSCAQPSCPPSLLPFEIVNFPLQAFENSTYLLDCAPGLLVLLPPPPQLCTWLVYCHPHSSTVHPGFCTAMLISTLRRFSLCTAILISLLVHPGLCTAILI